MIPTTSYSYVEMSALAISYNSVTKKATNISEILPDFTFAAVPGNPTVTTAVGVPTFTPD
jgi:hypothetical protein